ncbi:MAG: Sb-PDE family phosphodiesterase [Pseudomonadales bacterium]
MRHLTSAISLMLTIAVPAVALAHGSVSPQARTERAIEFPDTAMYKTLVVDLHTHTVFSDGHVWPTIRVAEAQRDGLDGFAVTEHLEYQPHITDIPHTDRNRSFEEARRAAAALDLIVIPGVEITRQGAPGHINAIFIKDANELVKQRQEHQRLEEHMFDTREEAAAYAHEASGIYRGAHQVEHQGKQVWMPFDDVETYFTLVSYQHATTRSARNVVEAANDQGAFLTWNHPSFESVGAPLTDFHAAAVEDGLLHGIEVANGSRYYQNAHRLALKHGLALIGVSDVHELIAADYRPDAGHNPGHRPVTLLFAEDKMLDSMREALFARRTVVWWKDTLIGRERDLLPLLNASIRIGAVETTSWGIRVHLRNESDASFVLRNDTGMKSASHSQLIELPAHGETEVRFSMDDPRAVDLKFTVMNALVAPNEAAVVTLTP